MHLLIITRLYAAMIHRYSLTLVRLLQLPQWLFLSVMVYCICALRWRGLNHSPPEASSILLHPLRACVPLAHSHAYFILNLSLSPLWFAPSTNGHWHNGLVSCLLRNSAALTLIPIPIPPDLLAITPLAPYAANLKPRSRTPVPFLHNETL